MEPKSAMAWLAALGVVLLLAMALHPRARAGTVELCGHGPVPMRAGAAVFPEELMAAAEGVLEQALEAMAAADEPARRAVGLYARAMLAGSRAGDAERARQRGCDADADCIRRALDAARVALAVRVEPLAALAATTRDARAYALAFYACQKTQPGGGDVKGSCGRISSAAWAELDPDNLVPWLYEAGRNSTGRQAAVRRAAQSTASRTHAEALFGIMEHPVVRAAGPASRVLLHEWVFGLYAAVPLPNLAPLLQHCDPSALDEAARRLQCDRLASALSRGSTLFELSAAARLGASAGWSAERVAALGRMIDASHEISAAAFEHGERWNCRSLQAMDTMAAQIYRHGEAGAAERALRNDARSVDELAERWRARGGR